MPPGPWSLPFLGVAYKLNPKASHLTYTEWNKKYGDVISFTLFGKDQLLINNLVACNRSRKGAPF